MTDFELMTYLTNYDALRKGQLNLGKWPSMAENGICGSLYCPSV